LALSSESLMFDCKRWWS